MPAAAAPAVPFLLASPAPPCFLEFFLPSSDQLDKARSAAARWHTGPGVHGIAPNCDWGFTGADCMTPICGVEKFHWPKHPYKERECAPQPTALSPQSFEVRVARFLYHLGLYPLPVLPSLTAVVLFLVLLHMIKANAQLFVASTLLFLWRMME